MVTLREKGPLMVELLLSLFIAPEAELFRRLRDRIAGGTVQIQTDMNTVLLAEFKPPGRSAR